MWGTWVPGAIFDTPLSYLHYRRKADAWKPIREARVGTVDGLALPIWDMSQRWCVHAELLENIGEKGQGALGYPKYWLLIDCIFLEYQYSYSLVGEINEGTRQKGLTVLIMSWVIYLGVMWCKLKRGQVSLARYRHSPHRGASVIYIAGSNN